MFAKISPMSKTQTNLFDAALACIEISDPFEKAACTRELYQQWHLNKLNTESLNDPVRIINPGRPDQPQLVHPKKVPKRSIHSKQGLMRLAHAIAHIEFNAINLALDAVYRFRKMPREYYSDWLQVAMEESRHFIMLADYLETNQTHYGDFNAHNGLWEMAIKTDSDVMVRMALVPRVLEARGLDVTPGMISRLKAAGEQALVEILEIIHQEEIGHVLIGTRWFNYICHQRNLSPRNIFSQLLSEHMSGAIQGPFDSESRGKAGFTEDELQDLIEISKNKEVVV